MSTSAPSWSIYAKRRTRSVCAGTRTDPLHSVNALTGMTELPVKYAARTINHQLSVLFGFYDHACATDL
ncbi:hypothetical protein TUM20985_21230 [Mycobacterium antarcticum]|nr:hypothetical protein TUM20985_21230 [Mycolicibacterium sp. TUM20985]